MAAVRKAFGRRRVQVAARLSLLILLAVGLAALTLIAVPARAEDDGGGATTALIGAPRAATSTPGANLTVPVGEEARGGDYARDWRHCVQVVANLRAQPPETPLVVLLGGSSARECTVLDVDWERQIARRSGYVVDAYNLGSKHRTFAQDLAFVKLLPPGVPTIVYIGVNLGRFCSSPGAASIRLPEPRALPHYGQHVYSRRHIQSYSTKRYYVAYWLRARYPDFRANFRAELAVLQKIIHACKRRRLRVALVDLPLDLPVIGRSFDGPVARYRAGCATLARVWDVPWLRFNGAARYRDRDFFDIFHLVEPGRAKFQSILSDKTIALLRRYHMPQPTPTPTPTPTPSPSSSASPAASPSPSPAL